MYCENCGNKLNEKEPFCEKCGNPNHNIINKDFYKKYNTEQKILKWNYWIHGLLIIFTYFLWIIVLIYINQDVKKKKVIINRIKQDKTNKEKAKIKYKNSFKVSGTSFHQKELAKIAKNGLSSGYIEAYEGQTDTEIKKEQLYIGQIADTDIMDIKLIPYKYEEKDAIKVLVNDYLDNYIEIGNIPEKEVNTLLPLLNENYIVNSNAYFVGGKYKEYDPYEEKVITKDLTIGIEIDLEIKAK